MTPTRTRNPFKPGDGQRPPYLAGRENEQGRLRQILADMADGDSPAANMVMYGPRGMGKTVLLNWLEIEAQRGGAEHNPIRTSWATPDELKKPIHMWNCLLPMNWKKLLKPIHWGTKFLIFSVGWKSNAAASPALVNTLIKECKKRPLVFLMDEAHTMDAGLCRVLLNVSQKVRKKAPFLLVLAGTPGLSHFLTTVGASFVERSTKMGIARLDAQATADAIVKPLQEDGITVDADALEDVVEDSQHYPYFIQLWGEALWDLAKEKDLKKLTSQEITEARTKIESRRSNFYEQRRATLDDLGLLPAAVAIATVFQDTETTTRDRLKEIIADNSPVDSLATQSVNEHLQTFIRHEFIWNPPDSILYEAGIPSLMTYVLDRQREHVQKGSPAAE
ncbi:AAA family ATPase [Candidatus Spongiihabitans sp.]|uniref:ATP-binding protein n=1 Tax=Candidatus Spongiihabitans sp. TaxID=3101308 RepID=UPI003C7B48EF